MSKFHAIVTAYRNTNIGGEDKNLPLNALQPLSGLPMLEWVVNMLHKNSQVSTITVIGPELLDELFCMRYVDRRLDPLTLTLENFFNIFPSKQEKSEIEEEDYLIVPCEAVYLTNTALDNILDLFKKSSSDIAIPVVDLEKVKSATPSHFDTVHIDGKTSAAGIMALTNRPRLIFAALEKLNEIHHNMLQNSGISLSALATIETRFGRPDYKQKFLETEQYETTISVLTEQELREAEKKLPNPYSPRFSRVMAIFNPKSGKGGGYFPGLLKKFLGIPKRSLDQLETSEQYKNNVEKYLTGIRY